MKKGMLLPILLIAATLALAVVSFFLLPEVVVTQITAGGGAPTTMQKLPAIALPTFMGILGAIAYMPKKNGSTPSGRWLLVSVLGVGIFFLMLFVNVWA